MRKFYFIFIIINLITIIMNEIKLENTKEEIILIVDENDNPVGEDLRTNMVNLL